MLSGTFIIKGNRPIAEKTMRMDLLGDSSACVRGGQFADVALDGFFLRRPLAVTEWDSEGISLIYKIVGEGTKAMAKMLPGSSLDILTGLGNGFDASACSRTALVVCGGLGASPAFSLVKELLSAGKKVTVILGFNKASEIVLLDEYRALGADVHVATLDGSVGVKGFVTDAIDAVAPEYDYFYTCGPKVMMKAVCARLDCPGEASLEERMGCGCGICYGCTCHTASGPRRVCADGPVFKKEEIIW